VTRDATQPKTRTPTGARRRRARRRRNLGRWLAVVVLAGVALAYVHPMRSYQSARDEIARKQAEVAELKRKTEKLRKQVTLAEQEIYVVREARTHGLVRAGETLFLVQGIEKWQRAEDERAERRRASD
jgi:cell division protein FtsB